MKLRLAIMAAVISVSLAGCGGGGGGGGGSAGGSAASCTPTMANPTACSPTISLVLRDGFGLGTTQVTPDSGGKLVATLKAWNGQGLAGTTVTFKSSDDAALALASSTAVTNDDGEARIDLPAGSKPGSFTAEAQATVGGSTVSSTLSYAVVFPALSVRLLGPSGTATTQVTPDSAGTLEAALRYPSGQPVANTVVSFKTSDDVAMVPATGTMTTGTDGTARVGLPAGSRAGGFTAQASATVKGTVLQASTAYAVTFPTLLMSVPSALPSTLSAGGNASITVRLTSNGQPYSAPLSVSFTSACARAGKAVLDASVKTQDGVAVASYADRGCGVTDTITASVKLGDTVVQQSGTLVVLPASAGSLTFVGADATNIALTGTGGVGRQEFSRLTFKVFDTTGTPVSGVPVDFSFADSNTSQTVGGLRLLPASATSGADGTVSTLVSGGTIPTSVRVKASVSSLATPVATLSNVLVVSTGVPDQRHFSLSTAIGNCEGRDYDQACSVITVSMADHFGNPVPDGTAVNFSAEGGLIDASCLTGTLPVATTPAGQSTNSKLGPGSGSCSVTLRSAQPKPDDGRITVLAYALGEEDFTDLNGNNLCDNCDADGAEFVVDANDKARDVYRDDNEDQKYTGGEPCVGPNASGACNTAGDRKYNGVLRNPPSATAPTLYVSDQLVVTFSGSHPVIGLKPDAQTKQPPVLKCSGGAVVVPLLIKDVKDNPMPAGTTIDVSGLFGASTTQATPPTHVVGNYWLHIQEQAPRDAFEFSSVVACLGAGEVQVLVTTPNKVQTRKSFNIQ